MNTKNEFPKTLIEAVRYFSDKDVCLEFMAGLRWPRGVQCPSCGCKEVGFIKTRGLWECKNKHAKRQFSVKVGTIFEDSALPLDKILIAIWLEANSKNSISSYELAKAIGATQKTAWFLQQRIRLAMQTGTFRKLSGEVEVDETFIGGKARNMHPGKRKAKGSGIVGKAVVQGLLERHGEVKAIVVGDTKRKTLQANVRKHVEPTSSVFTDALPSYNGLSSDYAHNVIDHAGSLAFRASKSFSRRCHSFRVIYLPMISLEVYLEAPEMSHAAFEHFKSLTRKLLAVPLKEAKRQRPPKVKRGRKPKSDG